MKIPVLDFSGFYSPDQKEKQKVADAVYKSFNEIGFLVLKNPGFRSDLIQDAFNETKKFYNLDMETKMKCEYSKERGNKGYLTMGGEKLDPSSKFMDLKETFDIGNDNEPDKPNIWPEAVPKFKPVLLEYYNTMDKVHLDLLRCISLGLNLDEEFLTPLCNENHQNLRLLRYPPLDKKIQDKYKIEDKDKEIVIRAGKHTDYGSLTLLVQDQVGGLQVKPRGTDTWIDVPYIENSIVVNVADMLMRWSNDILVSTPHRVISHLEPGKIVPERYSMAFFCNPNKKTTIEALPNTFSGSNPKKYPPVNSLEFLLARFNGTFKIGIDEEVVKAKL
eukprot:augustus_masked-scaffold_35-processed-gene-0.31-mRNA-1 protein AED:0.42 eAED:0.42 QI:0/-1/0/1/-1/1/1/0/331